MRVEELENNTKKTKPINKEKKNQQRHQNQKLYRAKDQQPNNKVISSSRGYTPQARLKRSSVLREAQSTNTTHHQ